MRILNRLISVVVVALLWQATQAADHGFYVSGAAGGSTNRSYAGAIYGTYKIGRLVFSARYFGTQEISEQELTGLMLFGVPYSDPNYPSESASDVAILVGLSTKYVQEASATLELGVARTTIVRRIRYLYTGALPGDWDDSWRYGSETKSTWGLAFQTQLYHHRFGLIVMGNKNPNRSFAAVLLALRIGKCN